MSPAKWHLFRLGLNELRHDVLYLATVLFLSSSIMAQEMHRWQQENVLVDLRGEITSATQASMNWQASLTGLIPGLHPANERRRYFVTTSHWLGASLESTLNKYIGLIFTTAQLG